MCSRELTVPDTDDAPALEVLPSLPDPVEEQDAWAIPAVSSPKPKASAKSTSRKKQSAILLAVFVGIAVLIGLNVGVKTWLRNRRKPAPGLKG